MAVFQRKSRYNDSDMKKVTKVIIPAAGLGTRLLPQTKAVAKEMLPILDKPVIQYIVEEAVAAGITDVIIVTSPQKRNIEDHFDHDMGLEASLIKSGKDELAKTIHAIGDLANFIYIRNKGIYGTSTPVKNAAHLVKDEPFLVLFPDDLFISKKPRAVQLVEMYEKYEAPIITLTKVPKEEATRYGVAEIDQEVEPGTYKLKGIIEKPTIDQVPSEFASVGGYILTPEILDIVQVQKPDIRNGELYLSQAIAELIKQRPIYGTVIDGEYHDTGTKQKYLETIVDFALQDPELNQGLREYLKEKL